MRNFIILSDIVLQNIPKVACYCDATECRGWFIPTRENQTMCLYGLRDRGLIKKFR